MTPSMTPSKQAKKKKRPYQQHGLHTVKKALASVGDMESWLTEQGEDGKQAKGFRSDLIKEQGGLEKITTKELATIDGAVALRVLKDSIARFLGTMECPVNKVKRRVFPIVEDFLTVFKAERDTFKDLDELRKNRPKKEPILLPDYVKSKAKPTHELIASEKDGNEATA